MIDLYIYIYIYRYIDIFIYRYNIIEYYYRYIFILDVYIYRDWTAFPLLWKASQKHRDQTRRSSWDHSMFNTSEWLLLACKMNAVMPLIVSVISEDTIITGTEWNEHCWLGSCCTSSSGFSSLLLAAGSSVTLSWVVTAAGFLRRIDPRELSVMLWIWRERNDEAPPTSTDVMHNELQHAALQFNCMSILWCDIIILMRCFHKVQRNT